MTKYIRTVLVISILGLAFWGGIGGLTGYARDASGDSERALPPRPTPNIPTVTPTPTATPTPTPTASPEPPVSPVPPVNPVPDLQISMVGYPNQVSAANIVVFTITVNNPEKIKAKDVKILGLIPAAFDVVSMSASQGTVSFNPTSHYVVVNIQPLPPYTNATITIQAKANALANIGESYDVAARLIYGGTDGEKRMFSNWVAIAIVQ